MAKTRQITHLECPPRVGSARRAGDCAGWRDARGLRKNSFEKLDYNYIFSL